MCATVTKQWLDGAGSNNQDPVKKRIKEVKATSHQYHTLSTAEQQSLVLLRNRTALRALCTQDQGETVHKCDAQRAEETALRSGRRHKYRRFDILGQMPLIPYSRIHPGSTCRMRDREDAVHRKENMHTSHGHLGALKLASGMQV